MRSWLALALTLPAPAYAQDARVAQLLAQLTLDEKLSLVEGALEPDGPDNLYQAGYLAGVPRLGIPPLRLADGPPGVATRAPSTGMTCTMGLAATFSVEDARDNGAVIGRDARTLGQDVVLEPFINLDRDTSWGRGFNTYGEDPLLTAELGASLIQGIQAQGVMAQAKHLLAFEGSYNVVVDAQTLHEVYLRPFEWAAQAGVASMMCGYNRLNDQPACGNASLLTDILRNELGFRGFVTSDWAANHAGPYVNAGLDMEMPGPGGAAGDPVPTFFDAPTLKRGLARGWLHEARLDEAVARILGQYARFGLLDGPRGRPARDQRANAAVVLRTAEHALTLLKNDGALPLRGRSVALIGAPAAQLIATFGGGEKPGGLHARQVAPREALRARGVKASFSIGADLTGSPIPLTDANAQAIDFVGARALPASTASHLHGTLHAPERGDYWLNIQALGATAQLLVDGRVVHHVGRGIAERPRYADVLPADGNAPVPTPEGLANGRSWVALAQGPHTVEVITKPDASGKPVQVRLAWVTPAQRRADRAAAIEAARRAETAIVFAWSERDLSVPLSDDQDALIADIARANANTVVVMHSSQPVALPWLSEVEALLQAWYPGDEGGWAIADVLTGKVAPSGHLPFSWPRSLSQTVAHQRTHPERSSDGVDGRGTCTAWGPGTGDDCGRTTYSEGPHIGYRFFDLMHEEPQFAFGHGLSYATFAYTALTVVPSPDGSLRVRFTVRNTGKRRATAVPQLYLGAPDNIPPGVRFATWALAGFTRVELAPGQSAQLALHVPARLLQYWSSTYGWTRVTGTRALFVGAHARDQALRASFTVSE